MLKSCLLSKRKKLKVIHSFKNVDMKKVIMAVIIKLNPQLL